MVSPKNSNIPTLNADADVDVDADPDCSIGILCGGDGAS